mgnify:CR=1 FL=1
MFKSSLIGFFCATLLAVLWSVILQIPLAYFQASLLDSVWPIFIYVSLFILQPILIYCASKQLLKQVKSLFFIAICSALLTGLSLQYYKMAKIDYLLGSQGILTTGVIEKAQTHAQRMRSTEWQVRALYQVAQEEFITPVFIDNTRDLQLGDTVQVIYSRSYPAVSRISN